MDNMTAKVSCFARAYHYNNNSIRIFTDDIAEKLLGEDYNQIAKSMSDGIDFFCPGFEGTIKAHSGQTIITICFRKKCIL